MSHPENQSVEGLFVAQLEQLVAESFRMAERIVMGTASKIDWKSTEARERYVACIPLLAMDVKGQLMNLSQMRENASQKQIDTIYDALATVIREVKKRNDSGEKE